MELTPRGRLLSLTAVITSSFSIGVAFGIGYPLTTVTLENWGESKWVIGLAGAAPAIGILLAMPALPLVVRRAGTVPAMVVGAVLAGACFLLLGLATNAVAWIATRVAMSAALAAPWLAGETWINMVAREQVRGRVIAAYAIAFFSGFACGPLVLSVIGTSGLAPFAVGAFGTAVAAIPILAARHLAPDLGADRFVSPLRATRLAPIAMVCAFMSGFAETGFISLIVSLGLAAGLDGERALLLLSILTAGGIVLQFPLGWLADRTSRIGVALALSAAFIVLVLTLPGALPRAGVAEALAFVLGGVILGFYSVGLAIVGEEVARGDLASANAAFIVLYQVGSITGPVISGVAMTQAPIEGFVATVVVLMALSALAMVWLWRRRRSIKRTTQDRG